MFRRTLLSVALTGSLSAIAQEDTTSYKGQGLTIPTKALPPTTVTVTGDHDVAPAPVACTDLKDKSRSDCLYKEVLQAIRARMDTADAAKASGAAPVTVTFVINQFGDMKDIRVEHTGTGDLSKKVVVALYGLPKFTPAIKGGVNVGTSVRVTYPHGALFSAE